MRLIVDGFVSSEYPNPPFSVGDLLRRMDVEPVPGSLSLLMKYFIKEINLMRLF